VLEGDKCPFTDITGCNDGKLAIGLVPNVHHDFAGIIALHGEERTLEVLDKVRGVQSGKGTSVWKKQMIS